MEDRRNHKGSRARTIIDQIVADERFRASSHFSSTVYRDEPLLTTGRQMAGYLPSEYSAMKAVSRWEEQPGSRRGRWLSEPELFYRQGLALASVEDDCPYRGNYKSSYPTYSTMSDRQLRGYVTWRTHVREGDIEPTLPAFAITYLQELICGIGVSSPVDGFERLSSFARAYRGISPEVDRRAPVWLQDYAIYHGLAPQLLPCSAELQREEHMLRLTEAIERVRETTGLSCSERPKRMRGALQNIDDADADALYSAAHALVDTGEAAAPVDQDMREDLGHVVCATLLRLDEHYRRNGKAGFAATYFGEAVELPYTMFASAVFFDPQPHPDAEVALSALHRYRCRKGLWSCTHVHGAQAGTTRLASLLNDIEFTTREVWADREAPQTSLPKYLVKIVVSEAKARATWRAEHAPIRVQIDTAKLAGIRRAAAQTREALLIEDERLDDGHEGSAILSNAIVASYSSAPGGTDIDAQAAAAPAAAARKGAAQDGRTYEGLPETDDGVSAANLEPHPTPGVRAGEYNRTDTVSPTACAHGHLDDCTKAAGPNNTQAIPNNADSPLKGDSNRIAENVQTAPYDAENPLSAEQRRYITALLKGEPGVELSQSEDLVVDQINEALFDLIGDTVLEFGPSGVCIIEDYRPDLEGIVHYD